MSRALSGRATAKSHHSVTLECRPEMTWERRNTESSRPSISFWQWRHGDAHFVSTCSDQRIIGQVQCPFSARKLDGSTAEAAIRSAWRFTSGSSRTLTLAVLKVLVVVAALSPGQSVTKGCRRARGFAGCFGPTAETRRARPRWDGPIIGRYVTGCSLPGRSLRSAAQRPRGEPRSLRSRSASNPRSSRKQRPSHPFRRSFDRR